MLRTAYQLNLVRQYSAKAARPAVRQKANDKILAILKEDKLPDASKAFLEAYNPAQSHNLASDVYTTLFRKTWFAEKNALKNKNLVVPETSSKELFIKYLDGRIAFGWMCGLVIMDDVVKGAPERGLESWIRFLETLGDTQAVSATVNREAAWSALVAYVYNCNQEGVPLDTKVALRLVPLKKFPTDSEISALRGFHQLTPEVKKIVLDGIKEIRLEGMDFNSAEFLKNLQSESVNDLEDRLAEARYKSEKSEQVMSELTYATFMMRFAEAARTQQAFELWNELVKHQTPTIVGFNALIKAAALSRQSPLLVVEKIISEMEGAGIQPDAETYATWIDLHFRQHKPAEAIALFQNVESGKVANVGVTLKIFNVVLDGLLKANQVEAAETLLEDGRKKGYSLNVYTYNSFIRTYLKQGSYGKVETMLQEMRDLKVEPSVATYTNIIDATFKACRAQGTSPDAIVDSLLDEMAANGLKANTVTLTSIMSGLIKTSRDIDAARSLFEAIVRKRLAPNARTFATIIDGEMSLGEPERALAFFNSMPQFNLQRTTAVHNQLIAGYVRRGKLAEAFKVFNMLVAEKRTDPNKYSYYFMLQGCENAGEWKTAEKVVDVLANHKYNFEYGTKLPKLLLRLLKSGVDVPRDVLTKAREQLTGAAKQHAAVEEQEFEESIRNL